MPLMSRMDHFRRIKLLAVRWCAEVGIPERRAAEQEFDAALNEVLNLAFPEAA